MQILGSNTRDSRSCTQWPQHLFQPWLFMVIIGSISWRTMRVLEKCFRKARSAAMLSPPRPQESSVEVVQISNCSFQCWSQEPDRLGWRSIETKEGQHGTFWDAGASMESEGGETPEPNTCIRTRALSSLCSASPLGCGYQPPSSVVRPGCRTAWVNSSCHILRYWHTISLQPCPQQLNLGSLPVSISQSEARTSRRWVRSPKIAA